MKRFTEGMGRFVRNVGGCMKQAYRDSDAWYHIPKSRFRDGYGGPPQYGEPGGPAKRPSGNAFLGSFRDCFARAWDDADRHYYIPKRRLADMEYNRTAYREIPGKGPVPGMRSFFGQLARCASEAWRTSDELYHLPRSRFRDPVHFARANGVLNPGRRQVVRRPSDLDLAVAGGGTLEGWTVSPPSGATGEPLLAPPEAEPRKPEISQ